MLKSPSSDVLARLHAWLPRLTAHARETRHVHNAPCPFHVSATMPGSKTGPTNQSMSMFPQMPRTTPRGHNRDDDGQKGDVRLCTTANINSILGFLKAIKFGNFYFTFLGMLVNSKSL